MEISSLSFHETPRHLATTDASLARPDQANHATSNEIENALYGTHANYHKLEPRRKGKRPINSYSRYHP